MDIATVVGIMVTVTQLNGMPLKSGELTATNIPIEARLCAGTTGTQKCRVARIGMKDGKIAIEGDLSAAEAFAVIMTVTGTTTLGSDARDLNTVPRSRSLPDTALDVEPDNPLKSCRRLLVEKGGENKCDHILVMKDPSTGEKHTGFVSSKENVEAQAAWFRTIFPNKVYTAEPLGP